MYQTFYPEQRIKFFSINDVLVLPNDTTYSESSIRRTSIQQTYTAYSNQWDTTMITSYDDTKNGSEEHTNSPMIANSELKIGDEFLKILQNNAFNGMNEGDVTDHIVKVLEIKEWIKMPNVEKNELRLHVFSKSLSGDAETWWNNEISGTTIT
nr:hypothetical protein [Tanacetum cinerariifolium]GEV97737.1 hypothetical protein [Tanacetum cinerariifolium]